MSPLLVLACLVSAVVAAGVMGPRILRAAAPALSRHPRLSIAAVVAGLAAWLGAVAALGPVLAWAAAGPQLFTGAPADVCRRCLEAASPFGESALETAVPAILLLIGPAVAVGVLAAATALDARSRLRAAAASSRRLVDGARTLRVDGRAVAVVADERRFACALPDADRSIVVSEAALRALADDELSAVIAHEAAHVDEGHHRIAVVLDSLAALIGRVPLVAASAATVRSCLEIAADRRAQRDVGTEPLVRALLVLGGGDDEAGPHADTEAIVPAAALHATGTARVRSLVAPSRRRAGLGAVVLAAAGGGTLAAMGAAAHAPYLLAAATGC